MYVAGDFVDYAGKKEDAGSFEHYIKQLEEWAKSSHAVPKVRSIYNYLRKGQLIKDLIEHNILVVDADHRLIEKWEKKHELLYPAKPPIFAVLAGGQETAFIRFNVYSPNSYNFV